MSHNPWGLCYSVDNRIVSLPLLHVKAVASLKELAAQVKITQTYTNDTDAALEAIYSFPIPARAAVCSFVMIKQDETRVVGHVHEKGEAREIYESVVAQGKQAALMEQQTSDVFRLAVGNIQPQEKVKIELIYATELAEDEENDSIRFHLPVHIGARYGQAPDDQVEQAATAFLEIFVDVEAVAPIAKIGCPSHTISTELGPDPALPNAKELPFSNYARVYLSSQSALDKDFVLIVKSAGLDAPRCVAELHPIHNTTALTLTLVPRFRLPDVSRQEFVFLIDRSGSMRDERITAAKKALVVMLRSLPAKGTSFQIASFGSRCTSLWNDGSRPYNQATLEDATQHVDGMEADYGGTKIREALAHCFAARQTDRPTSVFLLTDGAAWDVDDVLAEVKTAVVNCAAQAYLRVSVLGIGNSASTAMCEGIARVGNGTCMMVGEQETSFTGKIARMLKAARTPLITDIAVDWGVPAIEEDKDDAFVIISDDERDEDETKGKGKGKENEEFTLSVFDETVDPVQVVAEPLPPPPPVVFSLPPQVQQSPFKIRTLCPGNRLNVYVILQGKTVPKAVTLGGLTEDGSEIKLSVPVTLSNLPYASGSPPAIHALTARKIIQDIEDGQHAIATSVPDDSDLLARTVKACIVRLAKTYSISSSQASFVAVDESGLLMKRSRAPAVGGVSGRALTSDEEARSLAGRPLSIERNVAKPRVRDYMGRAKLIAPSSSEDTASVAGFRSIARRRGPLELSTEAIQPPPPPAPLMDPLEVLARLQSFDGCFAQGVLSTVPLNVPAEEVRAALGVSEEVFATIMAMAFLCTKLGPDVERDSWEAMYDKARAPWAAGGTGSLLGGATVRGVGAGFRAIHWRRTGVAGECPDFPSLRSGCPTSGKSDVALAAVQHVVLLVLCVRDCLNVEHEAGPGLSLGPKTTRLELRPRVRRRQERLSDPLRFPPGGCKHFGPSAFVWQPSLPAVAPSDRQAISRPAHCELQELSALKRPASADAFRGVGSQPSCTLVVGPRLKTFGSTNSTLINIGFLASHFCLIVEFFSF
ncbi:von Willebrand factor type A domain-containing protein [Mycena galopus ATCC 62051]|nr:von Willebrand factor type A domain-containing protein [Mycena galopus ATCC 62051]